MVFVADDLAGWLTGLVADAGRKKLTTLALGTDQERARWAGRTAVVQLTAQELRPDDDEPAGQIALVISQVFREAGTSRAASRAGDGAGGAAGRHRRAGSPG